MTELTGREMLDLIKERQRAIAVEQLAQLREFEQHIDDLLAYNRDARDIAAMLLMDTARVMATIETRDAIERIIKKCHAMGVDAEAISREERKP